jgi:DNA-binding response OmpR family regulator
MNSRYKVLVVDDEELSQEFLKLFLSKKFDVYTAGTVDSFYNLIAKITFDLVIMDVALRDRKDGFQLVRELKESDKYKNVAIIILSAFNSTKERKCASDVGADLFLTKPTAAAGLVETAERVLAKVKHIGS